MAEFIKPKTMGEFDQNFAQIKPLMDANMAFYESARCLFCYDAPCIKACPTEIDIPLFIRQISNGNLKGAAKTIYSSNYFGNTCGKVCPTEVLCEGACVYNEQDVKAIEIGRLQNHASHYAIEQDLDIFNRQTANGKKVAIIGAGPAGISCACELSSKGYEVEIFESKSTTGGLALHGTAPYKIKNQEVNAEIEYLQRKFGFKIHFDSRISSDDDRRLLENQFDAIFLGVGMGETRELNLEGEDLLNCVGATELIESLKSDPINTHIGNQVVVLGGGNTAMDAASECARMGAGQVTLVYRRSMTEMKAYHFELELAISVGVQTRFNAQPVALMGDKAISGIRCIRTQNIDGKLSIINGTEFTIPCDMVIKATGQDKRRALFDILGIGYDASGRIETTPGKYRCEGSKYFTGGDALSGGAEVVNACAEAKAAAVEIHHFLESKI